MENRPHHRLRPATLPSNHGDQYPRHAHHRRGRRGRGGSNNRNENLNNGRTRHVNSHGFAQQNGNSILGQEDQLDTLNSSQPFELPGFIYDETTRRHYRIAPDNSGLQGYSQSDLVRQRREKERAAQIAANRPRMASGSFAQRPISIPISLLTERLSLSSVRSHGTVRSRRCLAEAKLLNVKSSPNSVQEVNPELSVKGCQFLSVSDDGTGIVGCWSATASDGYQDREIAFVQYMSANIDDDVRNKALMEQERQQTTINPQNTMGLQFVREQEFVDVIDPSLVDMCVAPVDSDVTCCLYVTASTRISKMGLRPRCSIVMQPIVEWCKQESEPSFIDSPIYNIQWTAEQGIWSCAWTGKKMRVALGLEESAKILDVVSEQKFVISSKKKNVLCQQFSPDGNLLYMGLLRHKAIKSDLRMSSKHVVGEFDSVNVSNIHLLTTSHPDCVITENFGGELKLWDIRKTEKPLLEFKGHRNDHYRMSYQVDPEENFLFAVGDDGCTRGWSLASADLLCCVPSPRPIGERADFPRIAYNSRWGGRQGNAALVLAVGDTCRVHQLDW